MLYTLFWLLDGTCFYSWVSVRSSALEESPGPWLTCGLLCSVCPNAKSLEGATLGDSAERDSAFIFEVGGEGS